MTIGIIGSGNVGRALGQLFSHVGEQVIISHRHGVASLAPVIDNAAKQTVTTLIKRIGFDVVDLGSLSDSYPAQADGPLFLFAGDADQVRAQVQH